MEKKFFSGKKKQRTPGDKWMVHGPRDYIPRIEIGNIQRRYVMFVCNNYHLYGSVCYVYERF